MTPRLPATALALLLLNTPVFAPADTRSDEQALEDLMSLLDEETQAATEARANADYLPGMISVLHGKDLLAQGRRTVFDALSLVPGVQTLRGNRGNMIVLIRGMRYFALGGNAQIMLNSVPMISATQAQADTVLSLPLQQVERIEVTRGPGASTHGEYALSGVINVITRQSGSGAYAQADSHDSVGAGGYLSGEDQDSGLRWHANLSAWRSQGAGVNSGADAFTAAGLGHAPGPVDDREANRFAQFGLQQDRLTASLSWSEYRTGDYFGLRARQETPDDWGSNRQWSANLNQGFTLSEDLDLSLQANAMDYRSKALPYLLHAEGSRPPPGLDLGGAGFSEDVLRAEDYAERRYDIAATATWTPAAHTITAELGYADLELYRYTSRSNLLPPDSYLDSVQPLPPRNGSLLAPRSRRIRHALIQDAFSPLQDVYLTASLRYDDYSDLGDHLSPRLAAVWQLTPHHAVKYQYSQAIRPPTFSELYTAAGDGPGRDLPLQVQTSHELGYIYRYAGQVGRITAFVSEVESPTNPGSPPGSFAAGGSFDIQGLELEWASPLGDRWHLGGNLSYVHAVGRNTGNELPGSYRWLGNLMLDGRLAHDWRLNLNARLVGKQLVDGRSGDRLPGYVILDLGLTRTDLLAINGLSLGLGVRNLLDQDIVTTATIRSYPDHLPQPGRLWWMQLSKEF